MADDDEFLALMYDSGDEIGDEVEKAAPRPGQAMNAVELSAYVRRLETRLNQQEARIQRQEQINRRLISMLRNQRILIDRNGHRIDDLGAEVDRRSVIL